MPSESRAPHCLGPCRALLYDVDRRAQLGPRDAERFDDRPDARPSWRGLRQLRARDRAEREASGVRESFLRQSRVLTQDTDSCA